MTEKNHNASNPAKFGAHWLLGRVDDNLSTGEVRVCACQMTGTCAYNIRAWQRGERRGNETQAQREQAKADHVPSTLFISRTLAMVAVSAS